MTERSRLRLPTPPLARLRAAARRLRRAEDGASALEFALVGLPFLFLILSMFELALIFIFSCTLQNALVVASRTIRTGAINGGSAPPTVSAFVTQICSKMGWMQAECASNLSVDVRTETQFANPTAPDPMASGHFDKSSLTFMTGTAGQIVLVRAFYQWPLILPSLDAALSKANNGVDVLIETTTFVNEPYR